jgi:hypothetical protein
MQKAAALLLTVLAVEVTEELLFPGIGMNKYALPDAGIRNPSDRVVPL